jgi:ATP-dependent Lon protease
LIPQENEKNLEEVPVTIRRALKILPVAHMDEILDEAILGDLPVQAPANKADYALNPEKSVHH